MAVDRMAAVLEIERLTRKKAKTLPADKLRLRLERLEKRLKASERKRARRQKNLPKFSYDDELPITAKKTEIIRAIRRHPVVIVSGSSGTARSAPVIPIQSPHTGDRCRVGSAIQFSWG